jgi:hypothetical protein
MLETKLINEIIIKKGKITSIGFNTNEESYTATIASSKIDISRHGFGPESVCVYNRRTKETKWYFHHCCGLQGFDPYLGDRCPACESKTGLTDDASELFFSYESTGPNFNKLITQLDQYCESLEKLIKEK